MFEPFNNHKNLKLGVATAATQIEGDCKNTNWYLLSKVKGAIKDGSTPDNANKHYRLYKEDTALMKKMGIQIYRMGIEWGRIEPKKGVFDEEVMKHYIDEITLIQKSGIEVLVTLHHFSNPIWFEEIGGWTKEENIDEFLNFVDYVVTNLKGIVKEYCTINEANIYASNSYLFGNWYPQHKSMKEAGKVMKHLCIAHIESYKLIKKIDKNTKVGFANHMAGFKPSRPNNIIDKRVTKFLDDTFNNSINHAMAEGKFSFPMGSNKKKYAGKYIDFFGINYYTVNYVKGTKFFTRQEGVEHNDLGWEINPVVFDEFLEKFHKEFPDVEIYVTENGTCDKKDTFKPKYIYDHLKVVSNKEFVTRYYYWCFMDNWEWAEGEGPKFGLVECDFKTQDRKIRASGNFYSDIIKNGGVNQKAIDKYLVSKQK
jgi:beta-glucosidase